MIEERGTGETLKYVCGASQRLVRFEDVALLLSLGWYNRIHKESNMFLVNCWHHFSMILLRLWSEEILSSRVRQGNVMAGLGPLNIEVVSSRRLPQKPRFPLDISFVVESSSLPYLPVPTLNEFKNSNPPSWNQISMMYRYHSRAVLGRVLAVLTDLG